MKHVVRKLYWAYEKEEKWLNEMAVKGLALVHYSWGKYVFEDSPTGEYIYRIELLEHLPSHLESTAYISFLEETGVECVATYMRWIYLRKKAADGSFDIYSDIDSQIKYCKRINTFWSTLAYAELAIGFFNLMIGILNMGIKNSLHNDFRNILSNINVSLGLFVIILGILLILLGVPTRKRLKQLKSEKLIRE